MKYQVSGLFEIPADSYKQALEILYTSGLKPIDIRIIEVEIIEKVPPNDQ